MATKRKMNFGAVHQQMKESKDTSGINQEETLTQTLLNKISETSELDYNKKAFDVRLIPRNKLIFHKDNDYPMKDIEKLAGLILELGLIHNIETFYDEDTDSYIIDAGEKRTRAIDFLIETYNNYPDKESREYKNYLKNVKLFSVEGYPCSVKQPTKTSEENLTEDELKELDDLNTHIRLIESNESGRAHDPVRTQKKVAELTEYYRRKNQLLKGEKINVNAKISETLGISERQVKKHNAVSKLIPELYNIFKKNGITIAEGANYAQLSDEEQHQILALIEAGENKKEINTLYNRMKKMQDEIEEQKKNIKKLQSEKETAEENIAKEKRKATDLESKIRAKLDSSTPNAKEIEELQAELEHTETVLSEIQNKYKEHSEEQAKKIKKLEAKIKEKENKSKNIVTSTIRTAMQIESSIENIQRTVAELKNSIKKYKENYNPEINEKTPEEYETEIKNSLKWEAN